MSKYRKKPVVIEAIQILSGTGLLPENVRFSAGNYEVYDNLHDTWVKFQLGDWIITGINGETYPCVPDVFERTYEKVEEN